MRTRSAHAIYLRKDCNGRIGRIEVDTWDREDRGRHLDGGQGHDRHTGACCPRHRDRRRLHPLSRQLSCRHRDGGQAMAGRSIPDPRGQLHSRPSAQFDVSSTFGSMPTDIVCEGCFLGTGAASTLLMEISSRSGARDTIVCPGRFYKSRIERATSPVNVGNVVLPEADSRC
jgi:hypothetical protein